LKQLLSRKRRDSDIFSLSNSPAGILGKSREFQEIPPCEFDCPDLSTYVSVVKRLAGARGKEERQVPRRKGFPTRLTLVLS
jgi:hypothetical protein